MKKKSIIIENLSKDFNIEHEKKMTLFEKLFKRGETKEILHALSDINLSINKGDCLGVVGPNGSGKSTLLKLIAGIFQPTSGSIETNGRVVSLELGVGFHPELTAIENIFMYGSIMGLSEKYLKRNLNKIINFAGIKRFRDTELKNFSNGMRVRLAFSTAIQTKPDILLIDEVLSVGDLEFRKKSLNALKEFKKRGKTIILVSHSLDSIKTFCNKAILLFDGKIIKKGTPEVVIKNYVEKMKGKNLHKRKKIRR